MMNWKQLFLAILFGSLAIVYGLVQPRERNNIFIFVLWIVSMLGVTVWLIIYFKNLKGKKPKDKQKQ